MDKEIEFSEYQIEPFPFVKVSLILLALGAVFYATR